MLCLVDQYFVVGAETMDNVIEALAMLPPANDVSGVCFGAEDKAAAADTFKLGVVLILPQKWTCSKKRWLFAGST
jgi:hypothetical protein